MVLSAVPISINYGYDDQFNFTGGTAYTFDNINIYDTQLLKNVIDISYNKKQLIALTDSVKLSDYVSQSEGTPLEKVVTESLLITNDGQYVTVDSPNNPNGSSISYSSTSKGTVFTFDFDYTSRTVRIHYTVAGVEYYVKGFGTYNTVLSTGLPTYNGLDTFNYVLSGDSIMLFSNLTKNPVVYSNSKPLSGNLLFTTISPSKPNVFDMPLNGIFKLSRLFYSNHNLVINKFGQSDNIRYSTADNDISIKTSSGNINYNYLITAAYETASGGTTLDVNVNNLKNYYSPRAAQTVALNQQLKNYKKIFTGINEDDGYENIYLSYNSSVLERTFAADKDNYFHFPYGAVTTPLSSSLLIESGSYSNVTPARSDRIFKKNADYAKYTNWGTSSLQRGTYFCSWLSAGDFTTAPVWMDRYYDPNYINLNALNLSLSGVLTESSNNYPNIIWDTPSTFTFEQGGLYIYHRYGDKDNEALISQFPGLTYHVNNWTPTLINVVDGASVGTIYNYTVSLSGIDKDTKDPYFIPTNTYGVINTTIADFTDNTGNTLSFNLYQDDWNNVIGDQIVGNYFNGGVGLFNSNSILTPLIAVRTRDQLKVYNSDLNLITSEPYNTFNNSYSAANFILKSTYDNNYYVIDTTANVVYLSRFDVDTLINYKVALGTYNAAISANSSYITNAWLVPDDTGVGENIVIQTRTSNTTCEYYRFSSSGGVLKYIPAGTVSYNNFALDLSGNPVYYNSPYVTDSFGVSYNGANSCVDSQNTVFALSGDFVVRGKTTAELTAFPNSSAPAILRAAPSCAVIKITSAETLACDHEDNVWVLYNSNSLVKLDNNGKIIWNKQINVADPMVNARANRQIGFVADLTSTGVVYYALVVDGKSQVMYKINLDGDVVAKTSIPGLSVNGDFTGFDYQRRYIKPTANNKSLNVKLSVKDSTVTSPQPTYLTLNTTVSSLNPGWHHFAITYDETNVAALYVDGEKVDETPFTGKILYRIYNYNNNPQILLGATSFKTVETLGQYVLQEDRFIYNGRISDFRFYNKTLTHSDIRALSKYYLTNQWSDIQWNSPTGQRSYIDEIERFFIHRFPGQKSQYYDIKIKNSSITDSTVKDTIETNIRNTLSQTAPAYANLRNIIWE